MDELDPTQTAARELVAFAEGRGLDLSPLWRDWVFRSGERLIYFWHEAGDFGYTLQSGGGQPPTAARGESGTLSGPEQALQLLTAWLIDRRDAEQLPSRSVGSFGTT